MDKLRSAAGLLKESRRLLVFTGAGVSAESGVPTFRQALTGLWARFRPEQLATPAAFETNPRMVWEWYAWRQQVVAQARPNPAHFAIAALAGQIPNLTLVTQNVDGLHQRAGSRHVLELHGNLFRVRCSRENILVPVWERRDEATPLCPRCGGRLRPDVVWFGEALPAAEFEAAHRAASDCDLCLTVGTSAAVYPAAAIPEMVLDRGVPLIEVNLEPTSLTSRATVSLRGPAGEILPALLALTWPDTPGDRSV